MFMKFNRKQDIVSNLHSKRVLVIYGPRRVGKTTILEAYLKKELQKKVFYSTGDDFKIRELFESEIRDRIFDFARSYDLVAIDEAQTIPSIGLGSKMII